MYRLKARDIPAVIVGIALIVFAAYMLVTHPHWERPSGFGPDWQCTSSGRGGPDFCIKKDLLAPKKN